MLFPYELTDIESYYMQGYDYRFSFLSKKDQFHNNWKSILKVSWRHSICTWDINVSHHQGKKQNSLRLVEHHHLYVAFIIAQGKFKFLVIFFIKKVGHPWRTNNVTSAAPHPSNQRHYMLIALLEYTLHDASTPPPYLCLRTSVSWPVDTLAKYHTPGPW